MHTSDRLVESKKKKERKIDAGAWFWPHTEYVVRNVLDVSRDRQFLNPLLQSFTCRRIYQLWQVGFLVLQIGRCSDESER